MTKNHKKWQKNELNATKNIKDVKVGLLSSNIIFGMTSYQNKTISTGSALIFVSQEWV